MVSMCTAASLAATLLLLILCSPPVSCQETFTAGTAGHYAGPGDVDPRRSVGDPVVGSCGFGELRRSEWPFFAGAAVSPQSAVFKLGGKPAEGCGRCLEVQCTDTKRCKGRPSLQALVVDTCDSCAADRINLPFPLFVRNLTNDFSGSVPIRFRQVDCTPPGNIVIDVVKARATAGGFIQFALEQVGGGGMSDVRLRSTRAGSNAPFSIRLINDFGAVWQSPSSVPPPPLDVQITNEAGVKLIARAAISALKAGKYPTDVQFPK